MRNLDRLCRVWDDLDAAYAGESGISSWEFLKKLVANGDEQKIQAILAKAAADIESSEDSVRYQEVALKMRAVAEGVGNLVLFGSLNDYVESLASAYSLRTQRLPFTEFLDNMYHREPYSVQGWDFSASPSGVELITGDSIHKVNLVSKDAVFLPIWLKNIEQLPLSDSQFHSRVSGEFADLTGVKLPLLVISSSADLGSKAVTTTSDGSFLSVGSADFPVLYV